MTKIIKRVIIKIMRETKKILISNKDNMIKKIMNNMMKIDLIRKWDLKIHFITRNLNLEDGSGLLLWLKECPLVLEVDILQLYQEHPL